MKLFFQNSFQGGLNTRIDPSKLGKTAYPLLNNGRITTDGIRPVKKHLLVDTPSGTKQGMYALGKYLVLFVSGLAYWKDISITGSTWALVTGWTAMNTSGRIYLEPVPESYFKGSIDYTDDITSVKTSWDGSAAPTEAVAFVTDGTNQPRIIFPDGTWREVHTYAVWDKADPEYVPVGILPKKSGQKLFLVDNVRKNKIYQSVTGRFLDFVIDRASDGSAGADAESTFKTVDYNEITALAALQQGGLFVGTLYASYAIFPDYSNTLLFAEPQLPSEDLFPTGPINERSFADIGGDMAFITQHGIQAFNITAQTQRESNNYPFGAPIADLLIKPQTNTCATNYDTEALFSVDTIYGKVVLVYDTVTGQFVSIDTGFGVVTDFAVVKYAGIRKLFFLNDDGNVYEGYGSTENAVCRVYLGDFVYGNQDAGSKHKITNFSLVFSNTKESFDVQTSLWVDGKRVKEVTRTIDGTGYPEINPRSLPRNDHEDAMTVQVGIEGKFGWKTGTFVEWMGAADLMGIYLDGEVDTADSFGKRIVPSVEIPKVLTAFADNQIGTELAGSGNWELVTGLEIGETYVVVGEAHIGDQVVSDCTFVPKVGEINVNGSLRKVGTLKTVWDNMMSERPLKVLGAGDHFMSSGTVTQRTRMLAVVDKSKILWAPGNHDLDTLNGEHFFAALPSRRYYKEVIENVGLFFYNSGYNTSGAIVEPDGITESSIQGQWLKNALEESEEMFKIVILHHPPYDESTSYYPGKVALRLPFAAWGADMVISGHAHLYQRFSINNIPYIVLGPSGSDVRTQKADITRAAVIASSTSGHLKLSINSFNILVEWKDENRNVIDAFTISA